MSGMSAAVSSTIPARSTAGGRVRATICRRLPNTVAARPGTTRSEGVLIVSSVSPAATRSASAARDAGDSSGMSAKGGDVGAEATSAVSPQREARMRSSQGVPDRPIEDSFCHE